jgi:hypothetical protein
LRGREQPLTKKPSAKVPTILLVEDEQEVATEIKGALEGRLSRAYGFPG